MESKPQNTELRNNPENFHLCNKVTLQASDSVTQDKYLKFLTLFNQIWHNIISKWINFVCLI